MPIPTFKAVFG